MIRRQTMVCIKSRDKDSRELMRELISSEMWLICCTAKDPDNMSTYILENVSRYEAEGEIANGLNTPVFIEYGISPAIEGDYQFRIHDSVMAPILNEDMIDKLIDSMLKTFDVFIIEHNMVDRTKIWGKLGSEHEDSIVYINNID